MLATRVYFSAVYSSQDQALLNAARNAKEDSIEELKIALNNGANVNVKDIRIKNELNTIGYHYTALMWAAYKGHLNQVKYLLQEGADIQAVSKYGNTALHIAAREGHTNVYLYLQNYNPELRYLEGEKHLTPDQIAKKYHQENISAISHTFFSNSYFSHVKSILPSELALNIAKQANPISLIALSRTNKAWNKIFHDEAIQKTMKDGILSILPKNLRDKSWSEIYRHYYKCDDQNSVYTQADFIDRMHSIYIVGKPFRQYVLKGKLESLLEATDFFTRKSEFKHLDATDLEMERNYTECLFNAKDEEIIFYREFQAAASSEFKSLLRTIYNDSSYAKQVDESRRIIDLREEERARYFPEVTFNYLSKHKLDLTERRPIFKVTVSSEMALQLLENKDIKSITGKHILKLMSWSIGTVYPAYEKNPPSLPAAELNKDRERRAGNSR